MGVVWHVMGMLNSQVLGVFCTVEAEVLLFSNPTETVCGLYSGELFTPGSVCTTCPVHDVPQQLLLQKGV